VQRKKVEKAMLAHHHRIMTKEAQVERVVINNNNREKLNLDLSFLKYVLKIERI